MRSTNRFGQHVACALALGALLVFTTLLHAPISSAAPSQAGVSWDYKLLGKLNSAQNPADGRTIVITGSGSFNVLQKSMGGAGGYTILDAGGSVVGGGTWGTPTFDSFTLAAPGASPGEGGHLELEAQFSGTGAGALNGPQHVVIQCSMWGPTVGTSGYPWSPDFVEVGPYTVHKTGGVMFNLNQ
jgi:hypothetical protein